MSDTFSNVKDTLQNVEEEAIDTIQTVEENIEDYLFGGANSTGEFEAPLDDNGNPIYPEDYQDTDCEYLMKDEIMKYWNTVFAMMALFVVAFLVPYLLCCCNSRWPRCSSRWFFWNGVLQWIMGALLASSVFIPECLDNLCGAKFCSAHKYNPGQVWGGVVIGLGCILQMKACGQWRYARKLDKERNIANEAEKGRLVPTNDNGTAFTDHDNDGLL